MRPLTTLMATSAALVLGSGIASAGPCAEQISKLSKELTASDVGTGPTRGTPEHTAGEEKGQHPRTTIMGQQSEGRALSPGDVQRQSGIKGSPRIRYGGWMLPSAAITPHWTTSRLTCSWTGPKSGASTTLALARP